MLLFRFHKFVILSFFLLWLVASQILVKDYGVTWDEFAQRHHGLVVIDFINRLLDFPLGEEKRTSFNLENYPFRYHGLLFTTIAVAAEEALGITDTHEIYLLRHRMNTFLFWVAGMFFYWMLYHRFRNHFMALLGVIFLVLSPRIFADSFNNPKDLVFLPLYLISICSLIRLLEQPTWGRAVCHGLAMSLAIASRLAGMVLPLMTVTVLLAGLISERKKAGSWRRWSGATGLSLITCAVFSYAWWPALWGDVWGGLREIGHVASSFIWDKEILYAGTFYEAGKVPWHYLPVWIGITTPLFYLVGFGVGFIYLLVRLRRTINDESRIDVVWLLAGLFPLISAMFTHPVIYDGWRHLYFVYPFLLAIALIGVQQMIHLFISFNVHRAFIGMAIAIVCLPTMWFMVSEHPQQQVYFNTLAGRDVHLRYDVDYWGPSYREAYVKLAELDAAPKIVVTVANYPGLFNYEALPSTLRDRFSFTADRQQAVYYLTNFRGPEDLAALQSTQPPFDHPVHVFSTTRADYMGIYRLK
jgi:Dolichyl-phosphate-mannose-protein mannosyltransferase